MSISPNSQGLFTSPASCWFSRRVLTLLPAYCLDFRVVLFVYPTFLQRAHTWLLTILLRSTRSPLERSGQSVQPLKDSSYLVLLLACPNKVSSSPAQKYAFEYVVPILTIFIVIFLLLLFCFVFWKVLNVVVSFCWQHWHRCLGLHIHCLNVVCCISRPGLSLCMLLAIWLSWCRMLAFSLCIYSYVDSHQTHKAQLTGSCSGVSWKNSASICLSALAFPLFLSRLNFHTVQTLLTVLDNGLSIKTFRITMKECSMED